MCYSLTQLLEDRFSSTRSQWLSLLCISLCLFSRRELIPHTHTQSTTSLLQTHSFPLSNPSAHSSFASLLCYKSYRPFRPPSFLLLPNASFLSYPLSHIPPTAIMKIALSLVLAAASAIATTSAEPLSKRAGPGPHWDVSIFILHIATSFSLLSSFVFFFPFSVSHQFLPCPADLPSLSNLRALLFLSFAVNLCAQPHCPIAHFSNPDVYEYVSVAADVVPERCNALVLTPSLSVTVSLAFYDLFLIVGFYVVFLTRSWLCTSGDALSLHTNSQSRSLHLRVNSTAQTRRDQVIGVS